MNTEKLNALEKALSEDYGNLAGLVVLKGGSKVFEHYQNGYTQDDALHIFSVTKSVFSELLGIAIDKGLLSVSQRVLDFFPDYIVPAGEETIQKITVENLITMTAPYKYDVEPYEQFFMSDDPVKDALDYLGGNKPIGRFNYSGIGGTHLLSAILTNAVGGSVFDFAAENLFKPLDIDVPRSVTLQSEAEYAEFMNGRSSKGWVSDPQGRCYASWGLFLRPEDMAKIGQLYLNGGLWQEERIVSEAWVRACTCPHSHWDEENLDYGYLWWLPDVDSFAGMGDGGNCIYVSGKNGLVIAIGSLFVTEPKDRIELIKTLIEPLFAD